MAVNMSAVKGNAIDVLLRGKKPAKLSAILSMILSMMIDDDVGILHPY